jgi:hypothetical protein
MNRMPEVQHYAPAEQHLAAYQQWDEVFGQRLKHLLAQGRQLQTAYEDTLLEEEAHERRAALTVIQGGRNQ